LNNEEIGFRIESKVDDLTARMEVMASSFQQFDNFLRRDSEGSLRDGENETSRHRANLEGCRHSAKKILSMALSVVSALTEASSVDRPVSELGIVFTDQQRCLVHQWLEPIDEFGDDEDEAPPKIPSVVTGESTADSGIFISKRVDDTDDSESDLEAELIEHWQKKGTQKLSEGKYSEAVPYLERALERAELKHGDGGLFEGRDGALELLAIAYCRQGRLKDMEDILAQFSEKCESKTKVLEVLLSAHCEQGQWDQAEELVLKHTDIQKDNSLQQLALRSCKESKWIIAKDILLKHKSFEGRHEIVTLVSLEHCRKLQWDEAEKLLLEHVEGKTEQDCSQSLHMLAELYLWRRNLDLAARFGKRALQGREKSLGKVHKLFHNTLACGNIYRKRGNYRGRWLYGPLIS
jgi:tetratricopeptide (TPR) repeat protein